MEATMSLRFDKLRFVKKLQDANQPQEVAEAFADALDEALEQSQSQLLTKNEFELRMAQMENKMDVKLAQIETKLTEAMYKMAGFIIAGVGAMLGLFRFFG